MLKRMGPLFRNRAWLAGALAAICGLATGLWLHHRAAPGPAGSATARAGSSPVPATSVGVSGPRDYLDLLRQLRPDLPAPQVLKEPVHLRFAGHFLLREPVFLDHTGRLWITRDDAETTDRILENASSQQVILTRERPLYVHWSVDARGQTPYLIVPSRRGQGYELITMHGRRRIGQPGYYSWSRAISWQDKLVVPTGRGASVFLLGSAPVELPSPPLIDEQPDPDAVQVVLGYGPIAWVPPAAGRAACSGALRWSAGGWERLKAEDGWGSDLLHLVPLLDGSVLQLVVDTGWRLTVRTVSLDPMDEQQEKQILELISELSAPDPASRQAAHERLARYGARLRPIAERLLPAAPPETQLRLRSLLQAQLRPLLGGMDLVDGVVQPVCRYSDGGLLLYADKGVLLREAEGQTQKVSPAWLSLLPGQPVRLLNPRMMAGLKPATARLYPCGGDWLVVDADRGPCRFLADKFEPILRKDYRRFSQFLGIAQAGRYVFREIAQGDAQSHGAAQRPESRAGDLPPPATLIVDPTVPDPTPRLPVWLLEYPDATVGWDGNDWPAAKRRSAWALGQREWRAVDQEKERFYSGQRESPRWQCIPADHPARRIARAATQPSSRDSEWLKEVLDQTPLLVDSAGDHYFDGLDSLKLVRKDGTALNWPLPAQARGTGPVYLVQTHQKLLFLFNSPGRIHRIRRTQDTAAFELQATFTHRIPSNAAVDRMWVDPFDRLIIAYEGTRLAILFPQGFIPTGILNLMTAQDQANAWIEE